MWWQMALLASPATPKGIVVTVPVLVLSALVATIFLFFLLSTLSSCSCPSPSNASVSQGSDVSSGISVLGNENSPSLTTKEDVEWVRDQIQLNGLHMHDNVLRKGINPRTRAQQLEDLRQ